MYCPIDRFFIFKMEPNAEIKRFNQQISADSASENGETATFRQVDAFSLEFR